MRIRADSVVTPLLRQNILFPIIEFQLKSPRNLAGITF